jgi:hypothetical protein
MTAPIGWEKLVAELESQALEIGTRGDAKMLKARVEEAMSKAESDSLDSDIIDRLDQLLLVLTESSRDNVCTNTKCPHYNKKCRMR